ncbi:MAG: DNA repair protein RecN [Myxococcota bacterium]
MATVSMLARAMRGVLDITSQHEHVGLLDPDTHQEALDAYGSLESKRDRVADAYGKARTTKAALDSLISDHRTQRTHADELRRAIEAIDDAAPESGEVERLLAELRRLRHQHDLESGVRSAEESLYSGEGAVIESVAQIHRTLERLAGLDEELSPCVSLAGSVAAELDELAHSLGRYQHRIDIDPHRIEAVEDRLQVLRGLMRRHGGDVDAVLAARGEMADMLSGLATVEVRREELESQLARDRESLRVACEALSRGRKKVRESLANAIECELADLSLAARVHIDLKPVDPPGPNGAESVQMQISTNAGEPLRSLRRVASGGEMSRLLLALKNVLAHRHQAGTYIFDEIDTGIGGAVAEVLGAKLRSVATNTQVIAVTHLPQVAAFADVHFQVEKSSAGRRTMTTVSRLSPAQQVSELARMLGGLEITRTTRSLAQEMRRRAIRNPPAREIRRAAAS